LGHHALHGGRREVPLQGGLRPLEGAQVPLHVGAHHGHGARAHRLGHHPVRAVAVLGSAPREGAVVRPPGRAPDRAPRRGPALLLRDRVAVRLRRDARRVGLAQQVGHDGRPPRQLADDVVRGDARHGGARHVPRVRHARAGRDRRRRRSTSRRSPRASRTAGASGRSRSASCSSSRPRSPRRSARRSTSPRASPRSSATSSSTRACASACSSWASSSRS
jgi:hypothetical protein